MAGPLAGVKIVEFEALGPAPLAGMMLAQQGAEVTLLRRPQAGAFKARFEGQGVDAIDALKQVVTVDLKTPEGVALALDRVAAADALIEGNRPGVMERLGLGPAECFARNPRLVYARMTGWGQDGPLAQAAGHDLNYVALTGLLSLSSRNGAAPTIPPTIVGDASGALGLAFGVVNGVLAARATGQGRVVDAAIVDIASMLGGLAHLAHGMGHLTPGRPSLFLDSPFYEVYACADGGFVSVAALEPQFYALLLDKLGLADVDPRSQYDAAQWPALKARLAALFASQPRAHWCALLEGTDACFAPVLTLEEAAAHRHMQARGALRVEPGRLVAGVAPRDRPY